LLIFWHSRHEYRQIKAYFFGGNMKILLASPIHADALETLREKHEVVMAYDAPADVLREKIVGCDVLIFRSGVKITADVMAQSPNLRLILRAGSGYDNIDIDYVLRNGIRLVRIPGPGAKAVAEMAFAMMLNLARNIHQADEQWRAGHWVKHEMTGYLLTGKTLGIVGAGNIGSRTGMLGAAWGMKVLGVTAHYSEERAVELGHKGINLTTFDSLLAESDFVCLHVPKTPETTNLMNAKTLSCMKRGAYLINLARGGVVDELALFDALMSGHIGGAALDVHANEGEGKISPLSGLKNVILTPHIGAGTYDSQREIGDIAIAKIEEFEQAEALTAPNGRFHYTTIEVVG
jgi:D-3-phosphoglycerate dehydrogenase / 2-oxoglutarate reductase